MRSRLLKSFALFALLTTVFASYADNNDNGDVVDLGLPSGVKWATCNLGANSPEEFGDYYAWGEITTKDNYEWNTYKYCNGTDKSFTKYCNHSHYGMDGFTDTFTTLEDADDAATAVLGSDYSIPTSDDWNELRSQCYWVWTDGYNGTSKAGYIVYKAKSDAGKGPDSYSLSDAHIFLPAAGSRDGTNLNDAGSRGNYWSASLYRSTPCHAYYCHFYSGRVFPSYGTIYGNYRYYGCSVRPVQHK